MGGIRIGNEGQGGGIGQAGLDASRDGGVGGGRCRQVQRGGVRGIGQGRGGSGSGGIIG